MSSHAVSLRWPSVKKRHITEAEYIAARHCSVRQRTKRRLNVPAGLAATLPGVRTDR